MTTDADSFWQFALRCYARSGVAPLCLQLQDELRADVLLLLYLAWRADQGHALTGAELEQLVQRSMPLRLNLIEPLRAARRTLGAAARATRSETLRAATSALSAAELRGERLQAAWLAGSGLAEPRATAAHPVSAQAPIRDYLDHIGTGAAIAELQASRLSALLGSAALHRPA